MTTTNNERLGDIFDFLDKILDRLDNLFARLVDFFDFLDELFARLDIFFACINFPKKIHDHKSQTNFCLALLY